MATITAVVCLVGAVSAAPAGAQSSAQITRVEATPDFTQAHISFAYKWDGFGCSPGYTCYFNARAVVQPSAEYTCRDNYSPSGFYPYVKTVWHMEGLESQPPQTFNVDLPNASILPGIDPQRLCIVQLSSFGSNTCWPFCALESAIPLAEATLAVPPPPPPPSAGNAACEDARAAVHKAKTKLKKLKRHDAGKKAIKKAKKKLRKAKAAAHEACAD